MKKGILKILISIVLVLGFLSFFTYSAFAGQADNVVVSNPMYYDAANIKSLTFFFGRSGLASCTGRLVLATEPLNADGGYGDFTDFGKYGSSFSSFTEVLDEDNKNNTFGIITYTDEMKLVTNDYIVNFSFKKGEIDLNTNKTYYIYLWAYYRGHYYPDAFMAAVKVQDGQISYTGRKNNSNDVTNLDNFKNVGDCELPNHVYDKEVELDKFLVTPATCTSKAVYYKSCICGEKGTETFEGQALGHDYSKDPKWTWSGNDTLGYSEPKLTLTCNNDNTHKLTLSQSTSPNVKLTKDTTPAKCETDGSDVYTASVTYEGKKYETSGSDIKTVTINKLGHDFDYNENPSFIWKSKVGGGYTAQAVWSCKNDNTHKDTYDASLSSSLVTAPTCYKKGERKYTAEIVKNGHTFTDSKSDEIEMIPHDFSDTWTIAEDTHYHECRRVDEGCTARESEAAHYSSSWKYMDNSHWQICDTCGKKINESPHDKSYGTVWTVTKKATVSEEGSRYTQCPTCKIKFIQSIPKLDDPNGVVEKDVKRDKDAPELNFNNSVESLRTLLPLNSEEVNKVSEGKKLIIYLEIINIDRAVSENEIDLIKKAVPTSSGISYFDISLYKKFENENAVKIKKTTGGKISVTITIPEQLRKKGRTFDIIYIHDGKVKKVKGTYNEKNSGYSFETDEFSTYAISYHDHKFSDWKDKGNQHEGICVCGEKIKQNHVWDRGKITKKATIRSKGKKTYICTVCGAIKTKDIPKLDNVNSVNTSDENNIIIYISLLIVSMISMGIIIVKKEN
ncbi:hypothetical protein [Anaerofustis stercorihominis]|uniref:hypothetical protein n=1 Tax=Anaerofustis stercorihominis TaxID=214853 RepID=UPI00214CC3A2|nr:hypothetical protein [Anaerofustis stercorihominis]MCR2033821.1 hypothetical protein [Anaerofustis stercorihominis]